MTKDVEGLLSLYRRVMREPAALSLERSTYVLRHWDGMDGCWTDHTGKISREAALLAWSLCTNEGTRHVSYEEIDYYRIFPGDTRMFWDGSEDREMHR